MYLELVDEHDRPATTGQIVVTDYFNEATPMIRYKVGDYATWSDESCPCGRTLPVLKNIHGRAYDIIKTPAGRRSEEHTSELQSRGHLVCRLLLEKKKKEK